MITGGSRRLGVRLGQTGDRLVGVESTGIGDDPEPGAQEAGCLFACDGPRVAKSHAVSSNPGDGDDEWVMPGDKRLESATSGTQFGRTELAGPNCGTVDQVGDPNATLDEVGPVLVGHLFATVKITIDDAGQA